MFSVKKHPVGHKSNLSVYTRTLSSGSLTFWNYLLDLNKQNVIYSAINKHSGSIISDQSLLPARLINDDTESFFNIGAMVTEVV